MDEPTTLARRQTSSLVVPGTLDEFYAKLQQRPNWVEKRMPVYGTVFDGFVYLERRKDGFVAWSAGRDKAEDMDCPAVRVIASPDPRGTRLQICRTMTRRTRAGVALLTTLTGTLLVAATVLAGMGASTLLPWLAAAGLAALATWGIWAAQRTTALERYNRAWDELSAVVTPLALAEAEAPAPYRK